MKKYPLLITIILLFNLISCGSNIVNDPSISIVEANYPSLEIHSKGKIQNGLTVLKFKSGQTISDLNVSIKGYFNGDIKFFSSECSIDHSVSYEDNAIISLRSDWKLEKPCLLSVLMNIDYDSRQGSVKSYPFKGFILFTPEKSYPVDELTIKKRANQKYIHKIEVSPNLDYKGLISICGQSKRELFRPLESYISIDLNEIIVTDLKTCYIDLAFKSQDKKLRQIGLMVNYLSNFDLVAIPSVKIKRNKITLKGSDYISVISVGNKFKFVRKATFKYSDGDVVRLITSKGRLLLGTIRNKEVTWIR